MEISSNHHQDTPFPVKHRKRSLEIKGTKTEIVICEYDDTFLVMVTQIGSMGTIVHGRRDEPMILACARQLIEHISNCGSSKLLVLSLGLKDHSRDTLKDILAAVIENRLW